MPAAAAGPASNTAATRGAAPPASSRRPKPPAAAQARQAGQLDEQAAAGPSSVTAPASKAAQPRLPEAIEKRAAFARRAVLEAAGSSCMVQPAALTRSMRACSAHAAAELAHRGGGQGRASHRAACGRAARTAPARRHCRCRTGRLGAPLAQRQREHRQARIPAQRQAPTARPALRHAAATTARRGEVEARDGPAQPGAPISRRASRPPGPSRLARSSAAGLRRAAAVGKRAAAARRSAAAAARRRRHHAQVGAALGFNACASAGAISAMLAPLSTNQRVARPPSGSSPRAAADVAGAQQLQRQRSGGLARALAASACPARR